MTLFQRSSCLFFSIFLCAGLISSNALAKRDKRSKPDNPPAVEVSPESKLMGQSPDQTQSLLGPPSFKRSENGAEVWQYIQGGCVLNLFLFEKAPVTGSRVQYLDVFALHQKPDQPVSPADRQRCLLVFANRPAAPPAPAPK